jgi:hypothetical protein
MFDFILGHVMLIGCILLICGGWQSACGKIQLGEKLMGVGCVLILAGFFRVFHKD